MSQEKKFPIWLPWIMGFVLISLILFITYDIFCESKINPTPIVNPVETSIFSPPIASNITPHLTSTIIPTSMMSTQTQPLITPSQTPSQNNDQLANLKVLIADRGGGRLILIELSTNKILWQIGGLAFPSCVNITYKGTILVCDNDRVLEIGISEITKEWVIINSLSGAFESVTDAKMISDDLLLVSDAYQRMVMEVDWLGNIKWSILNLQCPLSVERLKNGETLIADGTATIKQFNTAGQITWSADLTNWATGAIRLPNNNTVVAEYDRIEVVDHDGSIIKSLKGFYRLSFVEQITDNAFLITEIDGRKVSIVDLNGNILWSIYGLSPTDAVLYP